MKLDAMKSVWTNQAATVLTVPSSLRLMRIRIILMVIRGHNSGLVYHWYDDIDNVQVTNPGTSCCPYQRPEQQYPRERPLSRMVLTCASKNITLGYTVPKEFAKRFGIENLRVYCNLQNLWTITGYKGYDPEVGASTADTNGYVYGLDNGRYPSPTVYSFGLSLTF